jgi:3-oxoacyl-(acyl-carrier-protein) synthase
MNSYKRLTLLDLFVDVFPIGACGFCASGAHAIGLGRDLIRNGAVDVAIIGAGESPHTYGTMREW